MNLNFIIVKIWSSLFTTIWSYFKKKILILIHQLQNNTEYEYNNVYLRRQELYLLILHNLFYVTIRVCKQHRNKLSSLTHEFEPWQVCAAASLFRVYFTISYPLEDARTYGRPFPKLPTNFYPTSMKKKAVLAEAIEASAVVRHSDRVPYNVRSILWGKSLFYA